MDSGFVKLYRGLIDSKVFANETTLKIWVWCLLRASYKDRTISLKIGKGSVFVHLKAGQFIFGRHRAEEQLGIRGQTVYRWLQKFETEEFSNMVNLEVHNQYTIVTICNWDSYQIEETESEQPKNNQRTANELAKNNLCTSKEHKQERIESIERIEDTNVSIKSNNKVVSTNIDFDKLVDFFNSETKGVFGNVRKPISKKRERLVSARIKEHGKDAFVEVVKKAMRSNFLKGDSGKFIMTFDWMILPTNFEKILSDNFKNRDGYKESSDGDKELADAIRRGIERGISQNSI